jgi:uncharacterized repeat protein (TIGR03803 family)
MKIMSFTKFLQAALLLLVGLAAVPSGWAQTYTVLYSFTGGADGAFPEGGLLRTSAGRLYGTTIGVGDPQEGSVFEVSASGKFKLLHSFGAGGLGGASPSGNLVRDSAGNLYGTTSGGGAGAGFGTVFKLDKKNNFSVFYSFPAGGADGQSPSGLTLDPAGNLYGAAGGGLYTCDGADQFGCGVVYKLDPSGNETVLHKFVSGKKGSIPNRGLLRDAAGNLYGTTHGSFNPYSAIVFRLDPAASETVLYTFKWKAPNGPLPQGYLIQDAAGNLYGAVADVVFKLDPNGNYATLYTFTRKSDGGSPNGGLVRDAAGNLYGTTAGGGNFGNLCNGGCGVVFKLDPSGNLTVLHSFNGTDGNVPLTGLTRDAAGNLYGTTIRGGNLNDCPNGNFSGCGVVFKMTP